MKPVYYCLLLLLLCPVMLQAQTNYKPGYVVTLEGDTLRGYINYKEWANTPTSFSFKDGAKSKTERTFDVTNTVYFEITGLDAYQLYEGPVTMNPVEIDRLTFTEANIDSVTKVEDVKVFLRVNYKGELLDLLSYTDNIKTRFFFQEKEGGQPQELAYKVFYSLRRGVALKRSNGYVGPLLYLVTQKGYVGQLQQLAIKYDVATTKVKSAIESAHYSESDLENLFSRMNEMRVSASGNKYRKHKTTRYFIGAGLSSSAVRISGISGLEDPDSNPASYMPFLTFGFDAFLNRHVQQFYFRVEGTVTAADYHVEDEREFEIEHKQQSYKIARQNFALSPQLIYTLYNKDNFKFHVGAMAQINYANNSENHYTVTSRYTSQYTSLPTSSKTEEYPGYRKLMPLWFSYAFRAGAVVNKRCELFATYMPYTAATQHRTSSIEFRSLNMGVNYLFKK